MRNRLTAFFVTVSLILSLLTTMALAAGPTLTVKTPETIPKAGEEFTVTVEISGNPGFNAAQFTLAYDAQKMECTDASTGNVLKGMLAFAEPKGEKGAVVAAASLDTSTRDGTVATFTFVAKQAFSVNAFQMIDDGIWDVSHNPISYTVSFVGSNVSTGTSGSVTSGTSQTPSGGTEQTVAAPAFPDVAGHWGEAWIVKAAERGLFGGDEKGYFHPDDNISRGEFVLVLWRMAGKPEPKAASPFADVAENAYYARAVAWASEQGYVNGKGNGFAPRDSLTRQEAMKILFGYAGGVSGIEAMFTASYDGSFNDTGEIASWAKPAMYWAVYNKIINGMNGGLNPMGTATRAQLAKILVEYQNEIETTTN